jgi:hypothetical protein
MNFTSFLSAEGKDKESGVCFAKLKKRSCLKNHK